MLKMSWMRKANKMETYDEVKCMNLHPTQFHHYTYFHTNENFQLSITTPVACLYMLQSSSHAEHKEILSKIRSMLSHFKRLTDARKERQFL
jgi:hypothetical protein